MLSVVRFVDSSHFGDGRTAGVPRRHRPQHVPVGVQRRQRVGDTELYCREDGTARGRHAEIRHFVVYAKTTEEVDVFYLHPHHARHLPFLPHVARLLAATGRFRQKRLR